MLAAEDPLQSQSKRNEVSVPIAIMYSSQYNQILFTSIQSALQILIHMLTVVVQLAILKTICLAITKLKAIMNS